MNCYNCNHVIRNMIALETGLIFESWLLLEDLLAVDEL